VNLCHLFTSYVSEVKVSTKASAPASCIETAATVAFGSTEYTLFLFDVATLQGTYIETATSLTVVAVPAPGALTVLAAAGAGVGVGRRRQGRVRASS
jgi:hypothetical protein